VASEHEIGLDVLYPGPVQGVERRGDIFLACAFPNQLSDALASRFDADCCARATAFGEVAREIVIRFPRPHGYVERSAAPAENFRDSRRPLVVRVEGVVEHHEMPGAVG